MRRVSGTFHYFRKDMEDKKSKNKWVIGATGYVGQVVTHRLFTERANANWTGQLITLAQKTIVPWIMERTNFLLFPLRAIPPKLFEKYPPDAIYHCARMAGNSDRSRRIAARKGHAANGENNSTQRSGELCNRDRTPVKIRYNSPRTSRANAWLPRT